MQIYIILHVTYSIITGIKNASFHLTECRERSEVHEITEYRHQGKIIEK